MSFKDHFSAQAADYAKYRPDYPQELYDFILLNARGSAAAWDCGTGNGQVAVVLSDYYENVFATDPSAKQIENAMPAPNVHYSVAPAEASGLPAGSMDLITVGQAVHWFDFDQFYAEVRRVSKPGATVVIWGYGLNFINNEVDAVVNDFYYNTLGTYWSPERKYLDAEYREIPFPFQRVDTPQLVMEKYWTMYDFMGYLSTWSSVQAYIKANGSNPLQQLAPKLLEAWGAPETELTVSWPIYLLAGIVQ